MRITKKENMEKIKQMNKRRHKKQIAFEKKNFLFVADYCHGTYYSLSFIAVIKIKCTLCLTLNLQVFSTKHKCWVQKTQQTEAKNKPKNAEDKKGKSSDWPIAATDDTLHTIASNIKFM